MLNKLLHASFLKYDIWNNDESVIIKDSLF